MLSTRMRGAADGDGSALGSTDGSTEGEGAVDGSTLIEGSTLGATDGVSFPSQAAKNTATHTAITISILCFIYHTS